MSLLPPTIQEFVSAIGHTKTMELVREFGGQNLRIPRTEGSDTWAALVEVIGERAAQVLADRFGGDDPIYIAKCAQAIRADRNRKLIARYERLLKEGHSSTGAVSILVRESKLSYRQVENIINQPLPAPTEMALQGALF